MVRLVEVVLKPGSRTCPPFSSAGARSGGQLSPGYCEAEASGNFHHCRGPELAASDNIFVERLWRTVKYEVVYLHAYCDGWEPLSLARFL